jgi:hypothetical protein
MFAAFNSCLCDVFSEVRTLTQRGYAQSESSGSRVGIEQVIDQIASRTIQLEVLDRKCITEARRQRSLGAKLPFRNKMLEHRRLQAQMAQLQRYRESALAHLDAVSNQEINQTFIQAIKGAGKKGIELKEAEIAIEDLQETVTKSQQLSDLLGQPIGEEITDDDLDTEFMDFSTEETEITAPEVIVKLPDVPPTKTPSAVRPSDLRVQQMFSMS